MGKMSKNHRNVNEDFSVRVKSNAKRKCNHKFNENLEHNGLSESVLWPETDGSFFSRLENLDTVPRQNTTDSSNSKCNNNFHANDSDDSLFCDISLPATSIETGNVGSTPVVPLFQSEIDNNDTLFAKIDLENVTRKDQDQLAQNNAAIDRISGGTRGNGNVQTPAYNTSWFLDNFDDSPNYQTDLCKKEEPAIEVEIPDLQSSQRFLDDLTFKVPKIFEHLQQGCKDETFLSKSMFDGIVHGTQYQLCQKNESHAITNGSLQMVVHRELRNLSHINWNSQLFPDSNSFRSKGEFYGLPNKVKQLIFEHKNIKSLYEWQNECLNLPAVIQRKNLIYALPTSGGKTLVAEILMLREIICHGKNVLFVLPYVSIVQEKVSAMSPFAISLDFIVDEYTAGKGKCPPDARKKRKSVFIASIEKGAILLDSLVETGRANEIGMVVVDELHLLGEKGRGATLEAFLTKVMFLNANIQIVGMSATIGNLSEISMFLNADVYTRGFRPIELKEYIKCGREILEINSVGKTLDEVFVHSRTVNFNYSEAVERADPDHLAGLVAECAPESSCLIFCPSRKNCENVALLLRKILPKKKFLEHRKSEKDDLMDALDKVCGILSPVLEKTIPFGIAYHHSGLTIDERKFIETAYRFGVISVVCCTSTLAAGVNLPAKRVIIRAPYVGAEFITLCKYKQMVGRAGRAGLGETGESILISCSRDNVRVGEMLFSPMDKAISSLNQQDATGLQALILSAIGLGLATCRRDLYRLIQTTLLAVQAKVLDVSVETLVIQILREMFKNRVLQMDGRHDSSNILMTQEANQSTKPITQVSKGFIYIGLSTCFQLTTIGKAAFKANIDYKRAFAVYNELKFAQKHLILANYSHLLYLVVCFNSNTNGDEMFAADASILFRIYTSLDENTQSLFEILGFTEAHAAKIAKTLSVHGPLQLKLNRLFKVLILVDILNIMPINIVATKYNIERGTLQNMLNQSIAAASAIVRLCDQIEEFWCFKPLFEHISGKMDRCGTVELEPLLDLPAVKINRAKQLYAAGFKTISDIAKCRPIDMVKLVAHMPLRIAKEIVSAAKVLLMKKLDHLEEETEALKDCLKQNENS